MNPRELNNKRIALLAAGGDEDWAVFTGIAHVEGNRMVLLRDGGHKIEIPSEWLDRIKAVSDEVREILAGADFVIPLTIGDLSPGEDPTNYYDIGLKWPE